MTFVRAVLVAAAFALAIIACERVVVLTPNPGHDGGFDVTIPDGDGMDTGGPGLDGGGLPDAFVPLDAS